MIQSKASGGGQFITRRKIMRDLASVVTVERKEKVFEKDRIVVVSFKELGYEAIVPSTTNVGDRMVFIQEGSILPEDEKWEFLRKRCYVDSLRGFLIKPMTMGARDDNGQKGDRVKSWGLCVTLAEAGLDESTKAGTDVTEALGIRKYEPAEEAAPTKSDKTPAWVKFCMKHKILRWIGQMWFNSHKKASGNFPSEIISKSDETTIQNCKRVLEDFAGTKAFITAKMEGQSFTCSLDLKHKKKFYVCSRNNRYDDDNQESRVFFETAKRYDIESKLKAYMKKTGVCLMLQGEQVGPGIQGNIYNFNEVRLFLFRMKGHENGKWVEYNYPKMKSIADELGLECVPLVEVIDDMGERFKTVDSLVNYAENVLWKPNGDNTINFTYTPSKNEKLWKNYLQHEGIVVKSENYNKETNDGFSFKVKNMSYQEHDYSAMNALCRELSK